MYYYNQAELNELPNIDDELTEVIYGCNNDFNCATELEDYYYNGVIETDCTEELLKARDEILEIYLRYGIGAMVGKDNYNTVWVLSHD